MMRDDNLFITVHSLLTTTYYYWYMHDYFCVLIRMKAFNMCSEQKEYKSHMYNARLMAAFEAIQEPKQDRE